MNVDSPSFSSRAATPDDEADKLHETLALNGASESIWLLKVPDFLYARWAAAPTIDRAGTLRVYPAQEGSDQQRISIVLPPELAAAQPTASTSSTFTDAIPSEYTLTINNAASRNMFVFGENENAGPPSRKRQRDPFIAGTIKHECSVMPKLGAEYTKIVRERQLQADQPKRRAVMLDSDSASFNRMASGVSSLQNASKFKGFVRTGNKGRAADKAVRMPRPDLERELFQLFDEKAYWQITEINLRLKQPLVYLKEVLGDLANVVPRGPYQGAYGLKTGFKGQATRPEDDTGTEEKPTIDIDDEDVAFDEVA